MHQGQYISVLDLGSSEMRMLVTTSDAPFRVVAYRSIASKGILHGAIVDLDAAAESLKTLLELVQDQVDQKITKVMCTLSGEAVSSINSHGVVKIKTQEVTAYDLEALITTAQAISLQNKIVLHVLPRQFKVDNQSGIQDPLGMYGVRLEGDFHIVVADQGICQNFVRCLQRVGLALEEFVFSPLGLSEVVLMEDERQQGVALLDIGEGTTDCCVFLNGVLVKSVSLPVGSGAISRDIAHRLKIDNEMAEKLKLTICKNQEIDLTTQLHGASCAEVLDVIHARYLQIIKIIDRVLLEDGLKNQLSRGYVMCGMASRYYGLSNLVSDHIGVECRIGKFEGKDVPALPQAWLPSAGVLYFSKRYNTSSFISSLAKKGVFARVFHWLEAHL